MINSFAFVPSLYASLLSRQLFSHLNAAALLAIARFLFMLPSASVSSGLIRAGLDFLILSAPVSTSSIAVCWVAMGVAGPAICS